MFKHSTQSTLSIVLALGLIGLGGCGGGGGGTDSTTTADTTTTPVPSTPVANSNCPSTVIPLTQAEVNEILFMREEEKLARDVYADLATYWQAQAGTVPVVTIMSNIVKAEQSHMDSVKGMLDCYGLPDPVGTNEPSGIFLNQELAQLYSTLTTRGKTSQDDALKVGGLIEEVDIEDLQRSIEVSQQAYPDQVYAALMCGSRNHLRGFAGQLIKTQGKYTAQLLPQAMVDAILATSNETCGGTSSAGGGKQNGKS